MNNLKQLKSKLVKDSFLTSMEKFKEGASNGENLDLLSLFKSELEVNGLEFKFKRGRKPNVEGVEGTVSEASEVLASKLEENAASSSSLADGSHVQN